MRKITTLAFAAVAATLLACSGVGTDGTTRGPGVEPAAGGAAATEQADDARDVPEPAEAADGKRTILFEVTGKKAGRATSVTYGVGGNSSQATDVKLPWRKEASSTDSFLLLSLVAQSGSGGNGTISCRITVDGQVIVENTSSGPYAVVTCSEPA